jgi:hypothetical protein
MFLPAFVSGFKSRTYTLNFCRIHIKESIEGCGRQENIPTYKSIDKTIVYANFNNIPWNKASITLVNKVLAAWIKTTVLHFLLQDYLNFVILKNLHHVSLKKKADAFS